MPPPQAPGVISLELHQPRVLCFGSTPNMPKSGGEGRQGTAGWGGGLSQLNPAPKRKPGQPWGKGRAPPLGVQFCSWNWGAGLREQAPSPSAGADQAPLLGVPHGPPALPRPAGRCTTQPSLHVGGSPHGPSIPACLPPAEGKPILPWGPALCSPRCGGAGPGWAQTKL